MLPNHKDKEKFCWRIRDISQFNQSCQWHFASPCVAPTESTLWAGHKCRATKTKYPLESRSQELTRIQWGEMSKRVLRTLYKGVKQLNFMWEFPWNSDLDQSLKTQETNKQKTKQKHSVWQIYYVSLPTEQICSEQEWTQLKAFTFLLSFAVKAKYVRKFSLKTLNLRFSGRTFCFPDTAIAPFSSTPPFLSPLE